MQVTLACAETGIPAGNVMISYMKELLLQNGAVWKIYLRGVLMWLKQQVCTETQMFLAARMH